MNQDQVKQKLLQLEPEIEQFALIFSGKQSKKVNGLYYPDRREIIIHNRNFKDDNGLIYTAIHEFAHHIHFTRSAVPISSRSHTTEYRNILHRLLVRAEAEGIYENVFNTNAEILKLTKKIRSEFLTTNGKLMKELGGLLIRAEELCNKLHARFDDYVERVLFLDKRSATTMMRMSSLDVSPELGYENMRLVANIRGNAQRQAAITALSEGQTPDMVKAAITPARAVAEDPLQRLFAEKDRIRRTIDALEDRIKSLDERIVKMRKE